MEKHAAHEPVDLGKARADAKQSSASFWLAFGAFMFGVATTREIKRIKRVAGNMFCKVEIRRHLSESLKRRSEFNGSSSSVIRDSFMGKLKILSRKEDEDPANVREYHYLHPEDGVSSAIHSRWITQVAKGLKVPRCALGFTTENKGFSYGPLRIEGCIAPVDGEGVYQKCIIPSDIEVRRFYSLVSNAKLLIVESVPILNRLIAAQILVRIPNLIIICSQGQPSYSTQYLAQWLLKKGVPGWTFLDNDIGGFSIWETFSMKGNLALKFMGIKRKDIYAFNRRQKRKGERYHASRKLPKGNYSKSRLSKLLSRNKGNDEIRTELESIHRDKLLFSSVEIFNRDAQWAIDEIIAPALSREMDAYVAADADVST